MWGGGGVDRCDILNGMLGPNRLVPKVFSMCMGQPAAHLMVCIGGSNYNLVFAWVKITDKCGYS